MPLRGVYLDAELRPRAEDGLCVYANYIASLDGRISLPDAHGGQEVPASLANARDWRLYQELAAQADVLIVSGRYVRQLVAGMAQAEPPVSASAEHADLLAWRQTRGLPPQPDIAIVSAGLDIPLEGMTHFAGRRVFVLTAAVADPGRRKALEQAGIHVIEAGAARVEGERLRQALAHLGYRMAYMSAGPKVHATLLAAGALDELFLTTRHVLLGGEAGDFHTIVEGRLPAPHRARLESLYLDREVGQIFARYALSTAGEDAPE